MAGNNQFDTCWSIVTKYLVACFPKLPELDWAVRLLGRQLGVLMPDAPLKGLILDLYACQSTIPTVKRTPYLMF